jgi:hypothetical protein
MNEEALNLSLRKFLKRVGVGSQRHIEDVVRRAVEEGRGFRDGRIPVQMTLRMEGFDDDLTIRGEIDVS